MRVLVACEESQAVTIELRKLDIEAYSCDLLTPSGWRYEWHLHYDVRIALRDKWTAIIAFPPCTHLAVSGAKHFEKKRASGEQKAAIDFFYLFVNANCEHIAIENPVGILSSCYRPPDQIIQPWMFGDPYQKTTCLWLKGLPRLEPTNVVRADDWYYFKNGKRMQKWYGNSSNSKVRSKTFPGIAKAMATQWSIYLRKFYK